MAIVFEIIDGIHTETGKPVFEVVENDNWKFPRHGLFRTKEAAQDYIVKYHEEYFDDNSN